MAVLTACATVAAKVWVCPAVTEVEAGLMGERRTGWTLTVRVELSRLPATSGRVRV